MDLVMRVLFPEPLMDRRCSGSGVETERRRCGVESMNDVDLGVGGGASPLQGLGLQQLLA